MFEHGLTLIKCSNCYEFRLYIIKWSKNALTLKAMILQFHVIVKGNVFPLTPGDVSCSVPR